MGPFFKVLKELIIPGITVVTALMVAWLNFSVRNVEAELNKAKDQREERESLQSFDLKIYDKVVASLETADPKKQRVAKALVVVMASPDLRENLLSVLEEAGTDTVRAEVAKIIAQENAFKAGEQALPAAPAERNDETDWTAYNYDIFWCEKSGEGARAFAQRVKAALKKRGAKGRIRIRELPASVNARRGYQISGYVIRANENEIEIADNLKARGFDILGREFAITFSGQPTPLYLSAFICPSDTSASPD